MRSLNREKKLTFGSLIALLLFFFVRSRLRKRNGDNLSALLMEIRLMINMMIVGKTVVRINASEFHSTTKVGRE